MVEFLISSLPALMFFCMVLGLFTGYPVAFVLGAVGIFFGLIGIWVGEFHMIQFMNVMPRIYRQTVENPVFVAIPLFIFMGAVLQHSKVADGLLLSLERVLSRTRGGLAIAVILVGTVLAAMTGMIGASVVVISLIALPLMMQRAYNPSLASGAVAAAGTLGILIPPSIMLVVMGDMLQTSVAALFAGAILPGLLLAICYILYIVILGWSKPEVAPVAPPRAVAEDGSRTSALREFLGAMLPPMALIFVVLGSIYGGWATPTEAAGVGCLGALVLAAAKRQLSFRQLKEMLYGACSTVGMVYFVIFGATLFSYVFRVLGGDEMVIGMLEAMGLDTGMHILIALMVGVFFLGFFFDWLEICLIALPIFGPILATAEFGLVDGAQPVLVWAAVLVAINMQTSFITPPFGFALFYMRGVAPASISTVSIYKGVIPFVAIQIVVVVVAVLFPDLILFLPRYWGLLF
ncbi:MAG: TRAP transporter large permease subunit [Pseudomonadota bacterium]|nr:TRAP transporter large permease subunit [Pseudomonadota bacterium]